MIKTKIQYEYKSVFKEDIEKLLYEKKQFLREGTIKGYIKNSRIFDSWCIKNNIKQVILDKNLVDLWMIKRECENGLTRSDRCSFTRQLARNMIKNEKEAYVIPQKYYKSKNEHIPYIFKDSEVINILEYFSNIKNRKLYPYQKETYYLMLKLLIYTGARKNEIINLKINDINFENNTISIIEGKEYIDRVIPLDEEIMKELLEYYNLLHNYGDENSYFFSNINSFYGIRDKVQYTGLNRFFRMSLKASNIEYKGLYEGPRIHDFRYTFVVKSIEKLVKEEKDLNVYLPILSKYLGHSNLGDTLYYFRPVNTIFDEKNYKYNNLIPKLNKELFYEE